MPEWHNLIRDIPDFPRPGIGFKDITPLLADADGFAAAIEAMAAPWRGIALDAVFGIESRGFIFGSCVARALNAGFVPIRKPGKLPWTKRRNEYVLEYGTDALEIHDDALHSSDRVVVIDDVLATGGTLQAALSLARQQGAQVVGAAVLVELDALHGRARWDASLPLETAIVY